VTNASCRSGAINALFGTNGIAGAPASDIEACGWPSILRPRDRSGLPASGAGGAGFRKAGPTSMLTRSILPEDSELSVKPPSGSANGDRDIGWPLKIPIIGARSTGGAGWSGSSGLPSGPTLRSRG
jgi:hypothetical protein